MSSVFTQVHLTRRNVAPDRVFTWGCPNTHARGKIASRRRIHGVGYLSTSPDEFLPTSIAMPGFQSIQLQRVRQGKSFNEFGIYPTPPIKVGSDTRPVLTWEFPSAYSRENFPVDSAFMGSGCCLPLQTSLV